MNNCLSPFTTRFLIIMAHLSGRLEQWACQTLHEMGVGATYSMGSEVLDRRCRAGVSKQAT